MQAVTGCRITLPRVRGTALGIIGLVALGCSKEPTALRMERPEEHWQKNGFVQMVQPLELPTRLEARDKVEVWLKLPPEGKITTRFAEGQHRHVIRLPVGSEAARVEYRAFGDDPKAFRWSVVNVRGTRFEREHEVFFALKPEFPEASGTLRGYSWPRDDAKAARVAKDKIVDMVSHLASPRDQPNAVAKARATNECASCHTYARPANARPKEHGVVNRATDDSGLFQIQAVLENRLPLESYFPRDPNLENPLVTVYCGKMPQQQKSEVCADGSVPTGELDLKAALGQMNPRAVGVCAARRYLYEHLDDAGRRAFSASFVTCGTPAP